MNNLHIALNILHHVLKYGVPEEMEMVFKPLVPILMFIIRSYLHEVSSYTTNTSDNDTEVTGNSVFLANQDITVVHYHALNILDRMCFYNDIMIPVYSSFFLSIELVISYSKCISYSFTIHYQSNLFTR